MSYANRAKELLVNAIEAARDGIEVDRDEVKEIVNEILSAMWRDMDESLDDIVRNMLIEEGLIEEGQS